MTKAALSRFLKEYPEALIEGVGAVFIGAGVSMAAGYPSWSALLKEIGEELGVESKDTHDLAALAQWSIQESGGATRVRNVIKEHIAVDKQVPESLKVIARLPVRHIWTTNYDRLIERAFGDIRRPIDPISGSADLALKAKPGAARLYKMHGSVDRLDELVISTDDYELYRSRRGAYLPLLQAHLTSMSMLFVGLSFTDPNIRHVLSLIRESFTDAPPEHFAIVRPPRRTDVGTEQEFLARQAQHKLWARDLKRYGLAAVEIDDYDEVPELLRRIERRVASRRIWISGSWPVEMGGEESASLYKLTEAIGQRMGREGFDLVTGTGLVVGGAVVSGFLDGLGTGGGWDLDRRLVARPFPQPLSGRANPTNWTELRRELARHAGVVIFLGGKKIDHGTVRVAEGVLEEFNIARETGVFLLPVGATGGAAQEISQKVIGSDLPFEGIGAARPTDDELLQLSSMKTTDEALLNLIFAILKRVSLAP